MINRSQVTFFLTFGLFISLLFYSSLDNLIAGLVIFLPNDLSTKLVNIDINIYQMSKMVATLILFLSFTRITFISFIICKITGEQFIGGEYKGTSWDYNREVDNNNILENHVEKFIIEQSAFEVKISGQSFTLNEDNVISTWSGKLFKNDENHYYFAMDMNTDYGGYGILKATFYKDEVTGFYYSGTPGSQKISSCSTFQATKISKKNNTDKNYKYISKSNKLSDFFQNSPLNKVEIDLERDKSKIRDNEIL